MIFYVYQILGVNPIEGFDKVKETYKRKHKEAMSNGDEEAAATVGFVSLSLSLLLSLLSLLSLSLSVHISNM